MKKHTQKCCRVASERCKGLLHEHRAALCAGEKTAHRFSQISKIYLSKKVTSLSYMCCFTSLSLFGRGIDDG